MANLKHIESDDQFNKEATGDVYVIDFFATWCGPCKVIEPSFAALASKHPKVKFLKVNVDSCQNTAQTYNITAMPTFVIVHKGSILQTLKGGNPQNITKIDEIISKFGKESPYAGFIDLNDFISKKDVECLNVSEKFNCHECFNDHDNRNLTLESDCDEQILFNLTFDRPVKLHGIVIKGPTNNGPKTVKLFINQTHSLDFDKAVSMEAIQTFDLTEKNLSGEPVILKYVKFQNVQNISVFIQNNQNNEDVTAISYLGFIGQVVAHTDMSEFKRVAGKPGEVHA